MSELQNHNFFQKSSSDHLAIQLKPELTNLVKKAYEDFHLSQHHHNAIISPNKSVLSGNMNSETHSSQMHGAHGHNDNSSSQDGERQLILNQSVHS